MEEMLLDMLCKKMSKTKFAMKLYTRWLIAASSIRHRNLCKMIFSVEKPYSTTTRVGHFGTLVATSVLCQSRCEGLHARQSISSAMKTVNMNPNGHHAWIMNVTFKSSRLKVCETLMLSSLLLLSAPSYRPPDKNRFFTRWRRSRAGQ